MFGNLLASLFSAVGNLDNGGAPSGCLKLFWYEPEMPKSMIER